MLNLSKVQIRDIIFDRCVARWDVYAGLDEEEMWETKDEIRGLITYFRKISYDFVKSRSLNLWVQLEVMLGECEIVLDGDDITELEKYMLVVGMLAQKIRKYVM